MTVLTYDNFVFLTGCLLGIIIIVALAKALRIRLRWISGIVLNSIVGCVFIYILNNLLSSHGFYISINPITAVFMGFLGIPGAISLVVLRLVF